MNNKRLFFYGGIIAPFLHIVSVVVAGALYPGYSHYQSFMSELAANGFEYSYVLKLGSFYAVSLLVLGFTLALNESVKGSGMVKSLATLALVVYCCGLLAAGVFSCDLGCTPDSPSIDQALHNIFGGIGIFALPVGILMWGVVFKKQSIPLAGLSFVIGSVTLVSFFSIALTLDDRNGTGLLQRVTISGGICGYCWCRSIF